jgi:hypothetical protein
MRFLVALVLVIGPPAARADTDVYLGVGLGAHGAGSIEYDGELTTDGLGFAMRDMLGLRTGDVSIEVGLAAQFDLTAANTVDARDRERNLLMVELTGGYRVAKWLERGRTGIELYLRGRVGRGWLIVDPDESMEKRPCNVELAGDCDTPPSYSLRSLGTGTRLQFVAREHRYVGMLFADLDVDWIAADLPDGRRDDLVPRIMFGFTLVGFGWGR